MYSIREKVTEKLSRLFADSPNNSADSLTSAPQNPQVRPHSKGGKSLTSIFSFVIPLVSFDGSKSDKQQHDLKRIRSLPVRRISEDFDKETKSLNDCKEWTTACRTVSKSEQSSPVSEDKHGSPVSADDDDKDCASGISSSDSDVFAEATDLPSPTKYLSNLTDDSTFITSELYEFLQSSLPNIVKGCQWVLLYSTLKHGISLRTLLRKSADLSGPCILIVGDSQGAVFGGMLECPLKPTPKRKYQGTNQTFVFTTIYGEPRIFRPTGANRYYYMCLNDLLALGGGGNFALCLDEDLLTGSSGPCETFGNLCLAHNPEFELKNVELWGFSHMSHYLR
ncbi:hypothetical protein ACOSQ2_006921 [Xanthoceras sorbifolium]|uniref:TLDc domain-containing protein n=1 Tax=Xanthoceras sorbifolium TaxID=99658 RepID=A0ABQ8I952_9ROSI|nr:hypothetical protein JRO89_XS03G0082700 [Xanthoceras sorbifolium]